MTCQTHILTQSRLQELLHYDPETGVFCWKVNRRGKAKAGTTAGTISEGYVLIRIDGTAYRANRLAFLYMTGKWPPNNSDHENIDRGDNRWINLRPATTAQNNANVRKRSAVGFKGVSIAREKFRSQIKADGKLKHLGYFPDAVAAAKAYDAAAIEYHGEFARTNFMASQQGKRGNETADRETTGRCGVRNDGLWPEAGIRSTE
ncbi:MAG TPA: HNH endonuclease [Pyrinomonadaceae bacterium]|nr:HNH endonuclease [Pyrinomonadaceae bacterium]